MISVTGYIDDKLGFGGLCLLVGGSWEGGREGGREVGRYISR